MTQDLATTNNNAVALSAEEQEAMEMLRQGSGENEQGGNYSKIPYITVDNRMVEETIPGKDGKPDRKTKVRCEPAFMINEKIGEQYTTTLFAPEFEAVILKFKHRVQRKYLQDQQGNCTNKMPFWRSIEFDSFQSDIYVRQNKEFLPKMKYGDVKKWALDGQENELWGICYFIIKGEEIVRKAEFKGASRGVLFDYMTAPRDGSVSAIYTKFSVEVAEDAAQPYNKLVLINTGERPESLVMVVKQQKALNQLLDGAAIPSAKAQEGEVVNVGGGITGHITNEVSFEEKPITIDGPVFD